MASTYKISDALDIVGSSTSKGIENLHTAGDLALRYIWKEHNWRESLAELPPFFLIPETRDYGNHGALVDVVPANFDSLIKAWLVHSDLSGTGATREEIVVKAQVLMNEWAGTVWPPNAISYVADKAVFRLGGVTPTSISAPNWWITGIYKKRPTKITGANASSTTFPLDDDYFPLYVEAVRWKFWQLLGDPRAGSIQVFGTGARQYSGQASIVHDLLSQAVEGEHAAAGPDQIYPEGSLMDW